MLLQHQPLRPINKLQIRAPRSPSKPFIVANMTQALFRSSIQRTQRRQRRASQGFRPRYRRPDNDGHQKQTRQGQLDEKICQPRPPNADKCCLDKHGSLDGAGGASMGFPIGADAMCAELSANQKSSANYRERMFAKYEGTGDGKRKKIKKK